MELGIGALEDEATRRAVEGVEGPVFFQGRQCGVVRKYSDTLLIFRLKAMRPEKYSERRETTNTFRRGQPLDVQAVVNITHAGADEPAPRDAQPDLRRR